MIALQLFQKNKGQHDTVEQIKDIGNGYRDGMISVNSHYQVIQHKGDDQKNGGFVYAYKNKKCGKRYESYNDPYGGFHVESRP
jgi:hypothetical protein